MYVNSSALQLEYFESTVRCAHRQGPAPASVRPLDITGLAPSFAASVGLVALQRQRSLGVLPDTLVHLMMERDALLTSTYVPASYADPVLMSGAFADGVITLRVGLRCCVLRTRDVLRTVTPDLWVEPETAVSLKGGYWVAERDVIDALLRLSVNVVDMDIELCGRRWWPQHEFAEELGLLNERTVAGKDGTFTRAVLSRPQAPSIGVMSIGDDVQQEPEHGPLHRALIAVDGEGWRPQVTLREAIMHGLALAHPRSCEQV